MGSKFTLSETSHKQITHNKLREGPSELRTISSLECALTDLRWVISVWNVPLKSESSPLGIEMHSRRHKIGHFVPVIGPIKSGVGRLNPSTGLSQVWDGTPSVGH